MDLLYKAYASVPMNGKGNALFPGFPMTPTSRQLDEGIKLRVELADGTMKDTVAVGIEVISLEESAANRFLVDVSGFRCVVVVPNDFDVPGIELGANVYLMN